MSTAAVVLAIFAGLPEWAIAQVSPDEPVFQLEVPNPTADKPQSKLWFAQDNWWAWLPTRDGSSVWRRTTTGWQRQTALDAALAGLPGRADVWADDNTVRAVLVGGRELAIITLAFSEESDGYRQESPPVRFELCDPGQPASIATATITRDGAGRWWIAYPWQRKMWVRATVDAAGDAWTEPFAISSEAADEDLCAIVALSGGVGLAWSDQVRDAMYFCWHDDQSEPRSWGPIEEIDQGQRTADNHCHAKVGPDGTLYLATKNSVDCIEEPQLVLRVRHPFGCWENLPYATRTSEETPSRPILLLGGDPPALVLLHTQYGRDLEQRRMNKIVWQSVPLSAVSEEALAVNAAPLIVPDAAINNVTGCKQNLSAGQPWIVLASDSSGNVYEGLIELADQNTAADE